MPLSKVVPFKRRRQRESPQKRYFAGIGSYNVKTVANMYRLAAYHATPVTDFLDLSTSMTLNDLEPPKERFW